MSNYKSYQELIEEKTQKEKSASLSSSMKSDGDSQLESLPGMPNATFNRLTCEDDWIELSDLLLSYEDKYDFFLDRAKVIQSSFSWLTSPGFLFYNDQKRSADQYYTLAGAAHFPSCD